MSNGFKGRMIPVGAGGRAPANSGNVIMPAETHAQGFRVVSLTMLETDAYNDQVYRPYETQLTNATLNDFQAIYQENGVNTHYSALGEVAGRILAPATVARGGVPIINGWREKRLVFVLVVEISRFSGVVQRCVFSGFTDYCGATPQGNIDPNMRLYLTNSTQININTDNLGSRSFMTPTLVDSSQIVMKNPFSDQYGFNDTFSMRPTDIVGSMQAMHLGGETIDYRSSVSGYENPITLSNVANNNASNYIGRVVNGIRLAMNNQNQTGGDWIEVLGNAKQFTADTMVRKHIHMKPLLDYTDFTKRKSITYRELMELDPNTDRVAHVSLQPRGYMGAFGGNNSQHWDDRSYETIIISRLKHSLSSIMMENFIAGIELNISNESGRWLVAVTGIPIGFMEDLPLDQYVTTFIMRLQTEVLPSLLPEGDNFVSITVNSLVTKDTSFTISYNFGPVTPYLNPTFANSLDSLVLTNNKDDLNMLASDIEHLCVDAGVGHHDYVTGNQHGTL